ncbi:MAG: DoxX family membrane protein [Acidobacteria bacterium]|nr:MAG: DoxX family membrane protein [Acidobacteriota bacterium]
MKPELNGPYWALRLGIGLTAFLAGLDKFSHLLVDWNMYLNPLALTLIPLSADTFMRMVGVVEVVVGIAILSGWTRLGAYVAAAWLFGIALNLVTMGRFFDIAVRDVGLSIAAFTLARLAEVRDPVAAHEGVRPTAPGAIRTRA